MRVLLVEDEYQLRALEKRMLQNLGHEAVPCESAEKALELLDQEPFEFILLDMVLPGMSGLEFSRTVRARPEGEDPYILAITSWPEDQLRQILDAGANDYIQKPIDLHLFGIRIKIAEQVIETIRERKAMQQLVKQMVAEDVLRNTLNGLIRVVTNMLALVAPVVFGRSNRVARLTQEFAALVNMENDWELSAAAMLSQIGALAIPHDIFSRALDHSPLTFEEEETYLSYAHNGANLLEGVPRMEHVARIVAYQEKHYDGAGAPGDAVKGDDIPVAARILKIALDLDSLFMRNFTREEAFRELKSRTGWYDTKLLEIFEQSDAKPTGTAQRVWIHQLEDGMILAENVTSKSNALLVMKGHTVTPALRKQLGNFSKNYHIQQPIEVYRP